MIKTPIFVLYLSLAGLLPIIIGMIGSFDFSFFEKETNILLYEFGLNFCALILSFLGGCIFVFEILLRQKLEFKGLAIATLPSIWAILSINLPISSFLLAIGFLITLERERVLAKKCQLPSWWLRMRFQLTTLIVIPLIIMGFNV